MIKQGYNPFLPSYEYIPDGEPYVFGDRLYVFGSHDKFNGKTFCMNDYVCWSAPVDDLSDWTYEGVIYRKDQDPLYRKKSMFMYAPDVQKGPDGRFYLYYFFTFSSIISVAVSDTPAGSYEYYGVVKYKNNTILGHRKQDPFMFDPGVLVDEDQRVFLYTGFCPKRLSPLHFVGKGKKDSSYVTELEHDMITVKQDPIKVVITDSTTTDNTVKGHSFYEASSIRKIHQTYYFIYSSEQNHELCYATSTSPLGPFTYGGVLVSNADIGYDKIDKKHARFYYGNNHGSIVMVAGKWYVFYHRQTNRHEYSRQACAEEIVIENNQPIKQVEMTSCGLNNGPLQGRGTYSSHIACNLYRNKGAGSYSPLLWYKTYRKHPYLTQTGIDRDHHPDQYIANIRDGSVIGYKYFHFTNLKHIEITVGGNGKGVFKVYIDLADKPIATIPISVVNIEQSFSSKTVAIHNTLPLYFQYQGTGFISFYRFTLD